MLIESQAFLYCNHANVARQPMQKTFIMLNEPEANGQAVVPVSATRNDQEKRIQAALGLACGPLPAVRDQWLAKYHRHLASRLSLPFEAQHVEDTGLHPPVSSLVTVTALLDPKQIPGADAAGLVCRVHRGTEEYNVPLVDLEVEEEHPNYQLLEDYWYWIWNWRFDPQI
jgi:hypothetical protein